MTQAACAECGCLVDGGVRLATCGDPACCCAGLPVAGAEVPAPLETGPAVAREPAPPGVSRALDRTFRVGMVLKGADGVLELIGGMILLFVAPATIEHVMRSLVAHELSQDPHDFVATHLLHTSTHLSRATTIFGAVYLLSHGAAKLVLVVLVLRDKLWAYPWMMALLVAFIVYQVYRITVVKFSFGLTALSVFDAVLVWLTWREYRARHGRRVPPPPAHTREAPLP